MIPPGKAYRDRTRMGTGVAQVAGPSRHVGIVQLLPSTTFNGVLKSCPKEPLDRRGHAEQFSILTIARDQHQANGKAVPRWDWERNGAEIE